MGKVLLTEGNDPIFYEITHFEYKQFSAVDEAGYDSDREMNLKRYVSGGIIGFSAGIVIGGMTVTFFILTNALQKLIHSLYTR